MFSSRKKSIKAMWTGLVMLAVLSGVSAYATTYTVTTTADSSTGSLRAAIAAATSGSDTIQFSLTYPATITLTSDQLLLSYNVMITGPGASNLTVSGGNAHRVFFNAGNIVTISGLTIANGNGTSATAPYSTSYNGLGGALKQIGISSQLSVPAPGKSAYESPGPSTQIMIVVICQSIVKHRTGERDRILKCLRPRLDCQVPVSPHGGAAKSRLRPLRRARGDGKVLVNDQPCLTPLFQNGCVA